jgi:hypothetical protein
VWLRTRGGDSEKIWNARSKGPRSGEGVITQTYSGLCERCRDGGTTTGLSSSEVAGTVAYGGLLRTGNPIIWGDLNRCTGLGDAGKSGGAEPMTRHGG